MLTLFVYFRVVPKGTPLAKSQYVGYFGGRLFIDILSRYTVCWIIWAHTIFLQGSDRRNSYANRRDGRKKKRASNIVYKWQKQQNGHFANETKRSFNCISDIYFASYIAAYFFKELFPLRIQDTVLNDDSSYPPVSYAWHIQCMKLKYRKS